MSSVNNSGSSLNRARSLVQILLERNHRTASLTGTLNMQAEYVSPRRHHCVPVPFGKYLFEVPQPPCTVQRVPLSAFSGSLLLFSLFLSLTRKPFICTSVSHEPPEPPYFELPRVYRLMRLSSVACLSLSFFFPFLFVVSAWTSRLDLRFAGRLFGGRCKHSSEPVRCIPYYPVHQCAVVKGFDSSSSFSS